jgi:hypothetical protein
MANKKYLILSLLTVISLLPTFALGMDVYVTGVVYSENENDCLSVIEAIEVRDLTYDPNSTKKIGETDENGLFLVDVNPANEGYLLEIHDPKGIYENENIQGDPTPKKQRESKKLVSKQVVESWDDKRVKEEIEKQMSRYSFIKNKFPYKRNWHEAVRRLVKENLNLIEGNLKPEIRNMVYREILNARKEITK